MQDWLQTLDKARLVQESLRRKVLSSDRLDKLEYVAGTALSYLPGI
jgi:deoxyinosine 3'endonuclease (endonuclease V)